MTQKKGKDEMCIYVQIPSHGRSLTWLFTDQQVKIRVEMEVGST